MHDVDQTFSFAEDIADGGKMYYVSSKVLDPGDEYEADDEIDEDYDSSEKLLFLDSEVESPEANIMADALTITSDQVSNFHIFMYQIFIFNN